MRCCDGVEQNSRGKFTYSLNLCHNTLKTVIYLFKMNENPIDAKTT